MLAITFFFVACDKDDDEAVTAVTGITLNEESIVLNVGENKSLSVNFQPDNATNKNVTWTSDQAEIASVDKNGKITGIAVGDATITATTEDGKKTASCKVTVAQSFQFPQSYIGTLSVTQQDNSTFTQENVTVTMTKTGENLMQMIMLGVKFSNEMPISLDMTVNGITSESSENGISLTGDQLIPMAMGGEFPRYIITGLNASLTVDDITLSMTCGGIYPLTFSGSKK
jgi:hypothetical protein